MANNKPTETRRDGLLKATIWKNEGGKGAFFGVNLTRPYQGDAGNYYDSDSFSFTAPSSCASLTWPLGPRLYLGTPRSRG